MKRLLIPLIAIGLLILVAWFSIVNFGKKEGSHSDPVAENTGWTVEGFIKWGSEVQVVKEQRIWKTPRYGEPILVEPNEPFCAHVMNDINEVPWATEYKCEWRLQLDPNKIPPPVKKVLDSLSEEDVGKFMSEILPYAGKRIAICVFKGKWEALVSSELLEVKLLSLSDDKLELSVETEPFVISDNPEIHGRVDVRVLLYLRQGCTIEILQGTGH